MKTYRERKKNENKNKKLVSDENKMKNYDNCKNKNSH